MYNALLGMRRYFLLLAGLLVTLEMGCASEPEVRKSHGKDRHAKRAKTGGWATGEVAGDDNAMGMEMSLGVLDERAVDRAMKPHMRALSACFARAGDARKYLSGQIVMRFVVTASGRVSDVQVIRNALGSYPVESCLVAEGKQIVFPAPEGRRGTDFEYSMDFQSTGERRGDGPASLRHFIQYRELWVARCHRRGRHRLRRTRRRGRFRGVRLARPPRSVGRRLRCGPHAHSARQRCSRFRAFQYRAACYLPHDVGVRSIGRRFHPQVEQALPASLKWEPWEG